MPAGAARPTATRRRQRSTRLLVASLLVVVGALAVVGTAFTAAWVPVLAAAVLAVVLGGCAVRIVWSEVVVSRRQAAADRAEQARAYRVLTEERTFEQALYVTETRGRLARHESAITRLEGRLADASAELAEAERLLEVEQERARRLDADLARARTDLAGVTGERDDVRRMLDDAEDRAAQAIVRVAELEQELDVVLAEWRAGVHAPERKHA